MVEQPASELSLSETDSLICALILSPDDLSTAWILTGTASDILALREESRAQSPQVSAAVLEDGLRFEWVEEAVQLEAVMWRQSIVCPPYRSRLDSGGLTLGARWEWG